VKPLAPESLTQAQAACEPLEVALGEQLPFILRAAFAGNSEYRSVTFWHF
jgi:hypothetical protein